MKIHESPVSYKTPLREAQIKLMAQWCRRVQALWDVDRNEAFFLEIGWIERSVVLDFFLIAEACGFVCKEWGVMDSLMTQVVYWKGVPDDADLKWLRYFIHSLVLEEKPESARKFKSRTEFVTLELGKKRGYTDLAEALEAQLIPAHER